MEETTENSKKPVKTTFTEKVCSLPSSEQITAICDAIQALQTKKSK